MLHEINNLDISICRSASKTAIITIAVGEFYKYTWEKFFKKGWLDYANKCNFDVLVFFVPLDESEASRKISLTWQKCLILEQPCVQNYDRVIWIDSDIAISKSAPNILESVPDTTKIGASFEWAQLSSAEKHILMEFYIKKPIAPQFANNFVEDYHKNGLRDAGFADEVFDVVGSETINSGVMVLSPKYHRELFRLVYMQRRDITGQEQIFLTYFSKKNDLFFEISPRFNWQMNPYINLHLNFYNPATKKGMDILPDIIRNELRKSYFLHFNGSRGLLQHLLDFIPNSESIFDAQ